MKKLFLLTRGMLFCIILTGTVNAVHAQLWKQIRNEVKSRAERRAVNTSGNVTDKVMDKVQKKAADALSGNQSSDNKTHGASSGNNTAGEAASATETAASDYKNYDFVAGDKIIFQPDMSRESDAELPARFVIKHGNAEIQTDNGEKILHLQKDGESAIAPLMSSDRYLPDQFTLEFDMLYEGTSFPYFSDFNVAFRSQGDQHYHGGALYAFTIHGFSKVSFGNTGSQAFPDGLHQSFSAGNTWHHIAIYVHKNIGKAYIDQYRVLATNTLPEGAATFDIQADRYGIRIKNLRLAAGGDDKYNKIISDGKFITHGILFDVGKSTIKPESMGTLNEIAGLMKDHSDLKFEIDGHTDSDGKAETNLKLSQDRANAVKAKLAEMGIADSRLSAKGFGAMKPIDKNDSPEGKANNRRVEFVKID